MKTLTLKRGKEESLLRFHPWVFSGAIARLPEALEEGEVVRVQAADGRFLGFGHYEIGSIAVRILTADENETIDESFFATRLAHAYALRLSLGLARPDNDAYRRFDSAPAVDDRAGYAHRCGTIR